MQTSHTGATKLEALAAGQPFRFYFRGERVIGIKAQFPRGMDAALVLSSTPALLTGGLLSGFDVGDVIALPDAKIIPSSRPDANSAGAGNFAQPGEIELHGNELIFVTQPHGDQRITYRVNLKSVTSAVQAAPRRLKFIPSGRSRMALKRSTSARPR
jgi:hypothetical protein